MQNENKERFITQQISVSDIMYEVYNPTTWENAETTI